MLMMYGIDPEMAQKEVEKAKSLKCKPSTAEERAQKAKELGANNAKIWNKWLLSYVDVLSQCEEIKQYDSAEGYVAARRESMNGRVNPSYILRNYLLEAAIAKAER